MPRLRLFLSLLTLAGLLAGLLPSTLVAREIIPAEQYPTESVAVRLYYGDRARLDAVAGELDIWEVHAAEGYVVAAVNPTTYQWLADQGYRLEIDPEKTAWLAPDGPLDPRYYYYDDFYANSYGRYWVTFLQDTAAAYPDITELIDIGDAWGKDHGLHAREIWVLRISNEDPDFGPIANKPPFMIAPQAHAREVTTPEVAIRYIKYLTSGYKGLGGYGIDPDVTWMVDWHALYILVGMNPDGHWKNEQDIANNWRKNVDNDDGCPTGRYGTDLNRNFAFKWGCCNGSSGNCSSDTYRGPSRASEPETAAVQTFFGSIFTDWNGNNGDDTVPPAAPDTTVGIWLSIHTYSDLVLWPWGFQSADAPNGAQLQRIGRKLAYYLELNGANYTPQQSNDLYTTDGSSDDWTYGKYGIPSYTFEMGPQSGGCSGFFPSFDCQEGDNGALRNFWAEFRPTAIYMSKIARMPYKEGYGPDAGNLVVTPASVPRGTPINLSALIQDHRSNGDSPTNAAGAEYFIDNPGIDGNSDGSGTPMAAQDGAWGGSAETAVATIDTAGLAYGRHYVLVHGYGSNGFWGPLTAVFFTVENSGCEAVAIQDVTATPDGCTASFSATLSGEPPFTYAWDFGPFGASSDPNPVVDFGVDGTYPYTLTVSNCSGGGRDTFHGQVTVACCQGPSAAAFTWDPQNPLVGEQVTFSGTASGTEPLEYAWSFGDGATGSGAIVQHAYALSGTYDVRMTVTNGCGEQAIQHSLVVAPPCVPVSNVDFAWTPPVVANQQATLVASADGSGPISYTWDMGDGTTAGGHTVHHTYGAAGDYTVVLTASNDCTTTTASATHVVTVVAPGIAVSTVPPLTLYPNQTYQGLLAISNTGDYTLTWDLAEVTPTAWLEEAPLDGELAAGDHANVTLDYTAPAITGTYTALLRVAGDDPQNPQVDREVVLHVVPLPPGCVPVTDTTFTWAPTVPYAGGPITFTASATGTPPIFYEWDLGDGASGSGAVVRHTYTQSGTYTVALTASNCLTGTARVERLVTVWPAACRPVEVVSVGQEASGCRVAFTPQLSGDPPFTYLWAFGDGVTSTAALPTHTYAQTGLYNASLNVWNCAEEGHDSLSFTVQVDCSAPPEWRLYLPIVVK